MIVVITPPDASTYEAYVANRLFAEGLHTLHLRLPGAGVYRYANFLEHIKPCYHRRIIVCDHYAPLLSEFNLGGIYLSAGRLGELPQVLPGISPHHRISIGVHSIEELQGLPIKPDYALLSPVFDSVSKPGYRAEASLLSRGEELRRIPFPVLALGGVTATNAEKCFAAGYDGVATIGEIWCDRGKEVERFLAFPVPAILSLAGHDPSGGAGITSDAKIATGLGLHCYTIPTALTVQSPTEFVSACPVDDTIVRENLRLLSPVRSGIRVAKIGMTASLSQLKMCIRILKEANVKRIIWDPIIASTAGDVRVLSPGDPDTTLDIMRDLYLITPNRPECLAWLGTDEGGDLAALARESGCNILLKGGHGSDTSEVCTDILYRSDGTCVRPSVHKGGTPKHGTGCMLSSAIASYLALGYGLSHSCTEAQRLVARAMRSSRTLLPAPDVSLKRTKEERMLDGCYRLQYITNTSNASLLEQRCLSYLSGGGRWIQLRLKDADTSERVALGNCLRTLCDAYDAVLIIDDDVEAALKCGADGVHLGREDMPPVEARAILGDDKIIGSTCNTIEDLRRAYRSGSDYAGIGPFRATATKRRLAPLLGAEGISHLVQYNRSLPYPIPLVAIGGITLEDVSAIMACGASGIAVSGEMDKSECISTVCAQFIDRMERQNQ